MKSNILLASIVALVTAVGAVAVFQPAVLIAEDDPTATAAEIANPALEANGARLTIALTNTDAAPGEALKALLTASNTTDHAIEVEVLATISTRQGLWQYAIEKVDYTEYLVAPDGEATDAPPADSPAVGEIVDGKVVLTELAAEPAAEPAVWGAEVRGGRSLFMLKPAWQETFVVMLAGGETKEIEIITTYGVQPGATVTLSLKVGEQTVSFDSGIPAAEPAAPPADPPAGEPTEDAPAAPETVTL